MFSKVSWGVWYIFGMMLWGFGLSALFFSFSELSQSTMYMLDFTLSVLGLNLVFSAVLDFHSLSFCGSVMVISGSVYYYSLSYMDGEKYYFRFMILVSFFILSMLVLIFSMNVIQLILGWDGLGLSSYLLVCYYNNSNSSNAGGLTLMVNRLGDVGLFIMIFLLLCSSHRLLPFLSSGFILSLLIIFVCSTKSAQVPFSAWLPAAMAAPTPVSSLVHSSTLVTAGVYLLIRFFDSLSSSLSLVLMLGVLTSISATAVAMFERDMKKIVALSTLSHLGIMVSIIGFNWVHLAFSHLIFHAFFKALLFLVVGYWIHSSHGYQDLMKISQLGLKDSLISVLGAVAMLSLCGLPYMTGFFSKDFFLEVCCQFDSSVLGLMMILLGCLGSLMYTARMVLSTNNWSSLPSMFMWGGSTHYFNSMILLYFLSLLFGSFWVNFWGLSESVLFVFSEMKLFISSMIGVCLLFGVGLSFLSLKSKFFSELIYLSSLSRVFANYVSWFLSSKSSMFDSSILSPYYNNYSYYLVSSYSDIFIKSSYFDLMKMMFVSMLLLGVLS